LRSRSPKRETDLEAMRLHGTLTDPPLASQPTLELGPDGAGSKGSAQNWEQDVARDFARPCHRLLEQEVFVPCARIDRHIDARLRVNEC
jgi:hypothetical protein